MLKTEGIEIQVKTWKNAFFTLLSLFSLFPNQMFLPSNPLPLSLHILTHQTCRGYRFFSVLKEAHQSDSLWPFISALTHNTVQGGKERKERGWKETVWLHTHQKRWLQKWMNIKHDKRVGIYPPGELPCLGKQAPALARRETCQGLICVFVHMCASKHNRGISHDTKELLRNHSTFLDMQVIMHQICIMMSSKEMTGYEL